MATQLTQDEIAGTTLGYASSVTTLGSIGAVLTDVPGLSTTVTVPNNGRKVKISYVVATNPGSVSSSTQVAVLRDGTVIWSGNWPASANSGYETTATGFTVDTPTAGSHTYKIQIQAAAGTTSSSPTSTLINQILVETI